MTQHTPEPWNVGGTMIFQGEAGKHITPIAFVQTKDSERGAKDFNYYGPEMGECEANADRIVACVNACEGINPKAVPELLKAVEAMLRGADLVAAATLDGGPQYPTLMLASTKAQAAIALATDKKVTT